MEDGKVNENRGSITKRHHLPVILGATEPSKQSFKRRAWRQTLDHYPSAHADQPLDLGGSIDAPEPRRRSRQVSSLPS